MGKHDERFHVFGLGKHISPYQGMYVRLAPTANSNTRPFGFMLFHNLLNAYAALFVCKHTCARRPRLVWFGGTYIPLSGNVCSSHADGELKHSTLRFYVVSQLTKRVRRALRVQAHVRPSPTFSLVWGNIYPLVRECMFVSRRRRTQTLDSSVLCCFTTY